MEFTSDNTQKLPLGMALLRIFYASNALLFLLTSLIFFNYLDIIILGKITEPAQAFITRLILIIFPLYLIFGISRLKREAYPLFFIYHLFFVINGVMTIFYLMDKRLKFMPLLEIILKPEYKTTQIIDMLSISYRIYLVHALSIFIGLIIILYLFKKRCLFTA